MLRRSALVAIALVAVCGCKASYPTIPSHPDAISRVILMYRFPTTSVAVGSSTSFDVYTVSPDGLYNSVTAQAQLVSSDLTVARTGGVGVVGVGPGQAEIVASYLGYTASLPVRVRPQARTYPFLELSGSGGVAGSESDSIRAILWQTPSQSRLVTLEATWSSSDPSIAVVNGGRLQSFRVGSVAITAAAGGVSETIYYGITPRY
jgi:hypothetical protein